jgi:hypothetical protein
MEELDRIELEKPRSPVQKTLDKMSKWSSGILIFRLLFAISMCGILWVYTFGHYNLINTWACYAGEGSEIALISYKEPHWVTNIAGEWYIIFLVAFFSWAITVLTGILYVIFMVTHSKCIITLAIIIDLMNLCFGLSW